MKRSVAIGKILISVLILAAAFYAAAFSSYAASDGEGKVPETPVLDCLESPGRGRITVYWKAAEGAERYIVYRQFSNIMDGENGWERVAEVSDGSLFFEDTGLSDKMVYAYTVKAVNSYGSSGYDPLGLTGITAYTGISVTSVKITDLSETGFSVHGKVVSSSGTDHITAHCWTAYEGRDDYGVQHYPIEDGRFSFRISTSSHNGESGEYVVHLYAADPEGRKSECYPMWITVPGRNPALGNPWLEEIAEDHYSIAMTWRAPRGLLLAEAVTYNDSDPEHFTVTPVSVEEEILRASIPAAFSGDSGAYHTKIRLTDVSGAEDSYEFTVDSSDLEAPDICLTAINVGAGDSMLLESRGEYLLIDSGILEHAAEEVALVLREHRVSNLSVLITHPHSDHFGGLLKIAKEFSVDRIYMNRRLLSDYYFDNHILKELDKLIEEKGIPVEEIPGIGESIPVGEASAEVIGPVKAYPIGSEGAVNNNSVWLRIHAGDRTVLLAGDSEKQAELDMLSSGTDLSCDLLKINHHGHQTSSSEAFIEALGTKEAFVSSCSSEGALPEILSRFTSRGIRVLKTADFGGLSYRFPEKGISVRYHRPAAVYTGTAPLVHGMRIINVTPEGYDCEVTYSSCYPLSSAETRTWTSWNGQDEMKVTEEETEGHEITFHVSLRDHGYEEGKYNSYIILKDTAGHRTQAGVSIVLSNKIAEESCDGLYRCDSDGRLYYLRDGCIDRSFTGLSYSQQDECWYYAEEGLSGDSFTGFIEDGARTIYVTDSRVGWDISGMIEYEDEKYYVKDNVLMKQYTGPVSENGIIYIVKNGRVSSEIRSQ